jgi:hypothetical protein
MLSRNSNVSRLCKACATSLSHLWEDNRGVVVRYHPHNTIRLIKEYSALGCEFCKYIALVLRLFHPHFERYDNVPLQIYLPGAKAWKGYRFVHLNWRPSRTWEAIEIPEVTDGLKSRVTQTFHPFGIKGL